MPEPKGFQLALCCVIVCVPELLRSKASNCFVTVHSLGRGACTEYAGDLCVHCRVVSQ